MLDFRSDNVSGIDDTVWERLASIRHGHASSYGEDDWTGALDKTFGIVFEREVRVFPVFTGTAANALALAALVPPWGAVLAHETAHIVCDEGGAPEFFSGAKLIELGGEAGKIDATGLAARLEAMPAGVNRKVEPKCLSITQSTENGSVYSLEEIGVLTDLAKAREMYVHMDGARLANAIVSLQTTPAAITWQRGIDVLSFGGRRTAL